MPVTPVSSQCAAAAQVQHQFAQRALAAMGIALRVAVHRGPHRRARLLQVQVLHRADRETAGIALVRVAEMVDRGEVGLEPARPRRRALVDRDAQRLVRLEAEGVRRTPRCPSR